jgi:hypothetical protein
MHHTHSTLLLFRDLVRDDLCNVVFLSLSLVFRQGPHLRMMFFSLRFSPLLLVVNLDKNGPLGVEQSTRWKYQIRPSGDRTPRKRRSPPDTGPPPPTPIIWKRLHVVPSFDTKVRNYRCMFPVFLSFLMSA